MRLQTQTDFALRSLMYLAVCGGKTTSGHIAKQFGISAHHLAKVLNQLTRLGYVRSTRGLGGGIELVVPPGQISVGKVIVEFEGSLQLLDCVSMDNVCSIQPFCKLKKKLAEAQRLQVDYLCSISLADVVPSTRQFQQLEVTAEQDT